MQIQSFERCFFRHFSLKCILKDDNCRTYTEYTTIINTDAGKKKTIVEKDSGRHMYDYLSIGDRIRFHPIFGTYEKYDKSNAPKTPVSECIFWHWTKKRVAGDKQIPTSVVGPVRR